MYVHLLTRTGLLFLYSSMFLSGPFSKAQSYKLDTTIQVVDQGRRLVNAWSGGMDTPKFSNTDINQDGLKDLVVYDRKDALFSVYLRKQGKGEPQYIYDPASNPIFADCNCEGWAQLCDIDCDGDEDLLCGSEASTVKFYQNLREETGKVVFKLKTEGVNVRYEQFIIPMYVSKIDVPSIVDIDYDGDLDILTFNILGNTVELNENLSMDKYGTCDSLDFRIATSCWGHFRESNDDNTAFIFDTLSCPLPPGQKLPKTRDNMHAGSTLLMLRLDEDSTYDALVGDITYKEVYALYNGLGTHKYAFIDSVEPNFPAEGFPISVSVFPACYSLDVTGDNLEDLLVAPHASEGYDNVGGVVLYKNSGSPAQPSFNFPPQKFLQPTGLDLGSLSNPVFFDYNQDGLWDLLIGNRGYLNSSQSLLEPALALLVNVGTKEEPAFRLQDRDFLNIRSRKSFPRLLDISPAVGDIDGDGDQDILLGNSNGTLYLFENLSQPGTIGTFQFVSETWQNIDVGNNSAPFLYDLDGDGDQDLLIGNRQGRISYYRNQSKTFVLITTDWGLVRVTDEFGGSFSQGFAQPILFDYDQDGRVDLLVGTVQGYIEVYKNIEKALVDSLDYAGRLLPERLGRNLALAGGQFGGNGEPLIFVGSTKGGIQVLRKDNQVAGENILTNFPVAIYPVPTYDLINIQTKNPSYLPYQVRINDLWGRSVYQGEVYQDLQQINISELTPGYYYIGIQSQRGYKGYTIKKE